MPEDRINPQPREGENVETKENEASNEQQDRFESDTQKIIHRHLEDKDDVISDEDIRNVRVGMTPPELDAATESRFEDEEARDEVEKEFVGEEPEEKDKTHGKDQISPWDTITE
jgi:hypothetical protein